MLIHKVFVDFIYPIVHICALDFKWFIVISYQCIGSSLFPIMLMPAIIADTIFYFPNIFHIITIYLYTYISIYIFLSFFFNVFPISMLISVLNKLISSLILLSLIKIFLRLSYSLLFFLNIFNHPSQNNYLSFTVINRFHSSRFLFYAFKNSK